MSDDRIPFLKFNQYAVTVEYKTMTPKELSTKLRETIAEFAINHPVYLGQRYGEITAKHIDLILAALDAYEPWVKCSERLPTNSEQVVVLYDMPGEERRLDIDYYDGTGCWNSFDPYVTHWKPLPKPPEEK